jgi:hypothetical protein
MVVRKSRKLPGANGDPNASCEEPPRTKRKMSVEQKAHKMIYDHFKDWTAEDTDVRVAGDPPKTLRATIIDDIRRASETSDNTPTFGKRYYEEKRLLFRRTTDPMSVLEPEDPDEAVNPQLLNAMVMVKRAQPDRSAFTQYLALGGQVLNASEVYGLFGWARTLNPANFDHLPCALDVLRFVARNKVHIKHPKVGEVMKPWFDEVLTAAWANAKRAKISAEGFIELESTSAPLVLDMEIANEVQNAGDDLDKVASQLCQLVASSALGEALFATKMLKVADKVIDNTIESHLKAFASRSQIRLEDIAATEAAIVSEVKQLAVSKALAKVRDVTIKYGSAKLLVKVTSIEEHSRLSVAAVWKKMSVDAGLVPKLVGEDYLNLAKINTAKPKIQPDVYTATSYSRTSLKEQTDDARAHSADALNDLLNRKMAQLLSIDKNFKIEGAILREVTGEGASGRVRAALEALFPASSEDEKKPETVLQQIANFLASPVVSYAPRETRSHVVAVQAMVSKIVDGRQPDVKDALQHPFTAPFVQKFEYFVRAKVEQEGKGFKTIVGTPALEVLFQDMKSKYEQGALKPEDTKVFEIFEWLMPDNRRQATKKIIQDLYQKALSSGAVQLRLAARSAGGSKAEADTESADACNAALAMFKSKKASSSKASANF